MIIATAFHVHKDDDLDLCATPVESKAAWSNITSPSSAVIIYKLRVTFHYPIIIIQCRILYKIVKTTVVM